MTTSDEERLVVLAPIGRDGALTRDLLAHAGIRCDVASSAEDLWRRAAEGVAGLFLAEEALTREALACLTVFLAAQPPWSDIPIVVFAARREEVADGRRLAGLITELGNVSVLERPLRRITLISAARAALRARHRQYEARAALAAEQRAVAARDEFLAMLGHELRNPIGAITLALEMLERGADGERYRAILRRQTAHLGRLVDDLLDVSRVTSGKIVLRPIAVDLGELVSRAVAAQEGALADRELAIDVAVAPAPVLVDPVRIEQVITNLLTNAIKYTPPGGHVRVAVERDGDGARVTVRDSGVGISAEMLPHVFELFTQVPGSLDRADGGLGIGLTLVRSLVALHGGSVEASSPGLGKGSTFVIRLPLAPSPPAPSIERRRVGSGVQRSVMIVEDNEDTCTALCEFLESQGHEVASAGDGLAALERERQIHPDVMIIDLGLPSIDGFEVARRVRATRGRDVYLIALTGYGQPDDRRRSFEAGFDEHFTKPADLAAITRLLARPQLASTHG